MPFSNPLLESYTMSAHPTGRRQAGCSNNNPATKNASFGETLQQLFFPAWRPFIWLSSWPKPGDAGVKENSAPFYWDD
jgi:hypothetical protein